MSIIVVVWPQVHLKFWLHFTHISIKTNTMFTIVCRLILYIDIRWHWHIIIRSSLFSFKKILGRNESIKKILDVISQNPWPSFQFHGRIFYDFGLKIRCLITNAVMLWFAFIVRLAEINTFLYKYWHFTTSIIKHNITPPPSVPSACGTFVSKQKFDIRIKKRTQMTLVLWIVFLNTNGK